MSRFVNLTVAAVVLVSWLGCSESNDSAPSATSAGSGASSGDGGNVNGGNGANSSGVGGAGGVGAGVGGVGAGDANPCQVSADLDAFITDKMAEDNIPGLAAGIVTDEGLVWAKGYGMANIAASIPVDENTFFALMSISKMVTAAGVMQQVEAGKLDLKADINTYFSGVTVKPNIAFQIDNPNASGTITLEHLLSHTSGIADPGYRLLQNNIKFTDAELEPLGEMLASFLHPQGGNYDGGNNYSNNAPGTDFMYSSIGISAGAYAAEVVLKTGFDELTQKNIFDRLGMVNTSWRLSPFDNKQDQLAVMYNPINGGSTLEAIETFTFAEYPAGTIRSNVPELARFLAAIINGGTYGNQQILKPASVAAMEEPPFPDASNGNTYGLGMFVAGDDLRAHGGDDAGAATDMAYNRKTKKGVIVLSNVTRRVNNDVIYQRMLTESELCP